MIPVFAQAALADAGKAGDLPLSYSVCAENFDDDAEVTIMAGLKDIWTHADLLDNLAHVGDA